MATKTYLLTIEETELTDELRALLERKGAYLQEEEPVEQLDPETAKQIDEGLEAIQQGEKGQPWKEIRDELAQRRANRSR